MVALKLTLAPPTDTGSADAKVELKLTAPELNVALPAPLVVTVPPLNVEPPANTTLPPGALRFSSGPENEVTIRSPLPLVILTLGA